MSDLLVPARPLPLLPVLGGGRFPVARVFCIGRNYVEHAAEMGAEIDRDAPFYFTQQAFSVQPFGTSMAYPPRTADLHHEVEYVAALAAPLRNATAEEALAAVLAHGVGLDMTRRDLQAEAKARRRPWDTGKDFEGAAIFGPLALVGEGDLAQDRAIRLSVNGEVRQAARLSEMVWSLAEMLVDLSTLYHLQPGDIVMTGTPAGVGPVLPGDRLEAEVEGLPPLSVEIGPPVL